MAYTFRGVALLSLAMASPALAYDLTAALASKPSAQFESSKTIYAIERCIIRLDMPDAAIVYRAPDEPNHSLIYWPTAMRKPMVVELKQSGAAAQIIVRNPTSGGMERRFGECA